MTELLIKVKCEADTCYWNLDGECISREITISRNCLACKTYITREEGEIRLAQNVSYLREEEP